MIPRAIVPVLALGHAVFNGALLVLLAFQGRLGWRIRSARLAGGRAAPAVIKRHRKLGPALPWLLLGGYLSGVTIAYSDRGTWLPFPLHFAVGTSLVAAAFATARLSRLIRAPDSPWRARHAVLGLVLLVLLALQARLGLGILL